MNNDGELKQPHPSITSPNNAPPIDGETSRQLSHCSRIRFTIYYVYPFGIPLKSPTNEPRIFTLHNHNRPGSFRQKTQSIFPYREIACCFVFSYIIPLHTSSYRTLLGFTLVAPHPNILLQKSATTPVAPFPTAYLAGNDARNCRVVALGGRLAQAALDVHPLYLARERAHDQVLVVDL